MKALGPSFGDELAAAGLAGLPFSWGEDGAIFGRENLTPEQNAALDAVIAAHDPESVNLAEYTAAKRWALEVGGAEWNGLPIHTDRESQSKYIAELQAISLGVRIDGDPWKFADGIPRPVTNADFPSLAIAAREHVRQSFAVEFSVLQKIADGDVTTVEEIDALFAGGAAP